MEELFLLVMISHLFAFFLTIAGVLGAIWVFSSLKNDYRVSYIFLTLAIVFSVSVYTFIDILIEYLGVSFQGFGHFIQDFSLLLGSFLFVISIVHLAWRTFPKRRKVERRERFLANILTQDVRNKINTSTGYLELMRKEKMGQEEIEYLEKSINNNLRISEILELADTVRRLDNLGSEAVKIKKILEGSIQEIQDIAEEKSVQIQYEFSKISNVDVVGSYALKELFPSILKTVIRKQGTGKVVISAEEVENRVIVSIEDDGEALPSDLKENINQRTYSGSTSEYGGPIYLLGVEMLLKYGGSIEILGSDLGGSRIRIELKKA